MIIQYLKVSKSIYVYTNYYVLMQTQTRSWGSENKSWQGGKECGWGQGPKRAAAVTVAAAAAAQR